MTRLTRRILVAASALILTGAAFAALLWVTTTTPGSRWLLESLFPLSGARFSALKVEGRISDRLLLTGVRLDMGQQKLEMDSIELRWKPLLLLAGNIAVQELVVHGLRIQDDSPPDNKPPDLSWPRVPEQARLFDGTIVHLSMTGFSYRLRQEQPLLVTSLEAAVTWQDDRLSITRLTALAPSGRMTGSLSAGFSQPSLTSELAVALAQPQAEMDRFSLQVRPARVSGPEPFVGSITLTGSTGTRRILDLKGDVGMARTAFNLRRLTLSRPGRNGLLTAEGSLALTARESLLELKVAVAGLDLAPELNVPTDLSGSLTFAGTLNSYRGKFTLSNKAQGWQATTVSASYLGSAEGMKLAPLNATLLDGSMAGNLDLDWRSGFALQGALNGRNLNPARLDPAWQGEANFNAKGSLAWSDKKPLTGTVSAALLESRLHGQALTGDLQADFAGNNLSLARLILKGKGFDLHASGELNRRLALSAQISDFSRLVPGAAGSLQGDGWLRWRDDRLSGEVSGTGKRLAYAGLQVAGANLSVRIDQGPGYPLHATAALRDVLYDGYTLSSVVLVADGTLPRHTLNATLLSGSAEARLSLSAGYTPASGAWQGKLTRLAGKDKKGPWSMKGPAAFVVSSEKLSLAPLALSAGTDEHLELSAELALKPVAGLVRTQWTGLNLARANPWLEDMQLSGKTDGTVRVSFLPDKRLSLAGNAALSGTFSEQGRSITIQRSLLTFDGSQQGLRVGLDLATTDGGKLKGTFSSAVPFSLAIPDKGELTADANGIDLMLIRPWLPHDTELSGHFSGRTAGRLLPGQRFELSGNGMLAGGGLHQKRPDGELNLAFSTAKATWDWRGDVLTGSLDLAMSDYGKARSNFKLPLAARFPVAFNPGGPLRATLSGQFQEKGIITTLFPGLVQESSGELDTDLTVSGTWAAPQVTGKLQLSRAGAYLPTAGIHLKDVQLTARLEKDLIRVDSFRALSGPGHLEGTALITLADWRVASYRGTIGGENFQAVSFPELRIQGTPKLTFEGTPQKLTLRGELRLPELNIVSSPSRKVVAPSSDVIREGVPVTVAQGPVTALALDVRVRVQLGDKAFVKVSGIDAQLGGALDLSFSSLDRITSAGEIKVVKGKYQTYGVNLEIVRGRLFFAGGPIDRPTLDFLALRTIGNIRAGVTVAGTLQKPVTKLYSEPAMPDADVLAYIVLGHPLGSNGEQASLLVQAAGALLSSRQAGALQDQIKDKLGLSTLEVQGGVGGTTGAMGYKPLQVTAPGAIPATQQAGITETVLTVGKYLTPQLYLSYGRSLFTGNNLFRLRYDIFKHWQIETQTGSGESGADLYYKLEFGGGK